MTSFLPLLEAFLALALTMLVLTVGVSSLTGTWERAMRSRARGLREMLRSLYVLEISSTNEARDALAVMEKADAEKAGAKKVTAVDAASARVLRRFVGEMSLQPGSLADIAVKGADEAAEFKKFLPGLAAEETSWGDVWSSLGDSLDTLSEDEFKARFKASEAGKLIKERDHTNFDDRVNAYYKQFVAYGQATTENFARNARRTSIICAAVLAVGANIDAFNLLETYIAQPALRGAIIEKYENSVPDSTIPLQPAKSGDDPGSKRSPIETVENVVKLVIEVLPPDKGAEISAALLAAKSAVTEAESAYADTRLVLTQATMTFPVGWSRYPGCFEPKTDPRCEGGSGAQGARWLFGVILTIVMLGLGTPFWIQTVNGLLRGRDLLRGGNQPGDGSKPHP